MDVKASISMDLTSSNVGFSGGSVVRTKTFLQHVQPRLQDTELGPYAEIDAAYAKIVTNSH